MEVIEHVESPINLLRNLAQLLKPIARPLALGASVFPGDHHIFVLKVAT